MRMVCAVLCSRNSAPAIFLPSVIGAPRSFATKVVTTSSPAPFSSSVLRTTAL
jgi:hypothetical protein